MSLEYTFSKTESVPCSHNIPIEKHIIITNNLSFQAYILTYAPLIPSATLGSRYLAHICLLVD